MEPPSSNAVSVVNQTGRRLSQAPLKRAVEAALRRHGASGAVSLLLTDDADLRRLNRTYRQVDEATDVLTFPGGGFPGAPLGDIAISVPYAERQAATRGVTLAQELGYLAIHGALHLAGMDDENEEDRAEMVREMNVVAMEAGLKPDEEWYSLLHVQGARSRA